MRGPSLLKCLVAVLMVTVLWAGLVGPLWAGAEPAPAPPVVSRPALMAAAIISITQAGFLPDQVTIQAGETVAWVNETVQGQRVIGGVPYRLYLPLLLRQAAPAASRLSLVVPVSSQQAAWDSGLLIPGGLYSHTFAVPGLYPFYLAGQMDVTGRVVVEPAPLPDFTLAISPAGQAVVQGQAVTYTVAVTARHGFQEPVSLTVTGLPAGLQAAWSENPVTPTRTTALLVTAGSGAPTGTITGTVQAAGGLLSRSLNFRLTVAAPPPACLLYPLIIPTSAISGSLPGEQLTIAYGDSMVIPGIFSWVQWDADANSSAGEQLSNLQNPANAGLYYDEPPGGGDDTAIDAGLDWVEVTTGATISTAIRDYLQGLINSGAILQFPVWNDLCAPGTCDEFYQARGTDARAKMMTFVALRLRGSANYLVGRNPQCDPAGTTGVRRCLIFEYSHLVPNACQGNGY